MLIFSFLLMICIKLNFPAVAGVVGGTAAIEGTYKYVVSLQRRRNENSAWFHYCGGSVLNKIWIITAAHCINPFSSIKDARKNLRIQAGTILSRHQPKYQYGVKKFKIHKEYVLGIPLHDIALIEVITKMKSKHIESIEVIENINLYEGDLVTVAGWGWTTKDSSSSPRKLQVLEDSKIIGRNIYHENIMDEICFTLTRILDPVGKGFCHGDSGGPVILKRDGREHLFGIISSSISPKCADGNPSFFTNVSFYTDWIVDVLSQRNCVSHEFMDC